MFNIKDKKIFDSYEYGLGAHNKLLEINNLMTRIKTLILKRYSN